MRWEQSILGRSSSETNDDVLSLRRLHFVERSLKKCQGARADADG